MTTVVGILMIETFIFSLPASSFSLSPLLSLSFFLSISCLSLPLPQRSFLKYHFPCQCLCTNFLSEKLPFVISFGFPFDEIATKNHSLTHSIHFLLILVFVTSKISFLLSSSLPPPFIFPSYDSVRRVD